MKSQFGKLTVLFVVLALCVSAQGQTPITVVNPCFVIKKWDVDKRVSLTINGKAIPARKDFRWGVVRDTDGTKLLVVWIRAESEKSIKISLAKK